jgi:citrate lyase beta subunit
MRIAARTPVHTFYGGAHLFQEGTFRKLGKVAIDALRAHAESPRTFARLLEVDDDIYERVEVKLAREPIEDFRIDFEDGYGYRADAEEDVHATASGEALSDSDPPPFIGIRIKPFTPESRSRAERTLRLFLAAVVRRNEGVLPGGFAVTLPKVTSASEVARLADALSGYERQFDLAEGHIRIEIMVETPQAIMSTDGRCAIPGLIEAAAGRCTSLHFGPFDYLSSFGIASADQRLSHPLCDSARHLMQIAAAPYGIRVVDGPTSTLPLGNRDTVHAAWKLHFGNIRRSFEYGIWQSWDLHPAQLAARYAAVYSFFGVHAEAASARLRNFMDAAAVATAVGSVFDDAATAQGLVNYFGRALDCGAITEADVPVLTGLTVQELRTVSIPAIMRSRLSRRRE